LPSHEKATANIRQGCGKLEIIICKILSKSEVRKEASYANSLRSHILVVKASYASRPLPAGDKVTKIPATSPQEQLQPSLPLRAHTRRYVATLYTPARLLCVYVLYGCQLALRTSQPFCGARFVSTASSRGTLLLCTPSRP
jgi:hypothetical protein